jgi:hypothetical protein
MSARRTVEGAILQKSSAEPPGLLRLLLQRRRRESPPGRFVVDHPVGLAIAVVAPILT